MSYVNKKDLRESPATKNVPAVLATTTTVVSNAPGILRKVVVIAAGTASCTFYDNSSTGSGSSLFVTPATTALGTIYDLDLPAVNGITAVGSSGAPSLTVSYL